MNQSLDLALVGNCTIGALVDSSANIVWSCFPRFDADPVFCALLQPTGDNADAGYWSVDIVDPERTEQSYLPNTAVVLTRLYDSHGGIVEIHDFAPRFRRHGQTYRPAMLVRRIRRLAGNPRIRIRLRPLFSYGAERPVLTQGSQHVRYVSDKLALRLVTDGSITAILQESAFFLEDTLSLLLGPDEPIAGNITDFGREIFQETVTGWHDWVRALGIPFEWQEAVIRAAITLKLNAYDDTGAIIAAMTTSIPEAADTERNWDYRYCWLRDGYFVVNALNRLATTHTMERYLSYIVNIAAGSSDTALQPVFRIDGGATLDESTVGSLAGYRGMGPVRTGNQAYIQVQHDVYGSAILSATHVFFDQRLSRTGGVDLFRQLEPLGERARQAYQQPDAGLWELRGKLRIHTFSSVMCWAACDRLARIAERLDLPLRATYWRDAATEIEEAIHAHAWSEQLQAFTAAWDGDSLDASLLLLNELGFLRADDPRFAATVDAIEAQLKRGDFIFRYVEEDDFGEPTNAFFICTFWYIYALAALGRQPEARDLFEKLLRHRNRHGLLAEHIDPATGEMWGNYVQTYSMVGLINAAIRLSIRWDQAF
jgi:GH15 family glucan-1,4-alpha-glucosidase